MVEFIVGFFITVGVLTAAVDVGTQAYNYAEPKVQQGVDYIEEKLN